MLLSVMTQQMGEIICSQRIMQGSSAAVGSSDTTSRTNIAPTTQSLPQPNMFSLTTALEKFKRSTGASLQWQCCTTTAVASESLPDIETVSPPLRAAILDGKDINLASLLIPHFDLGDYSRYAGVDGSHHLLRLLSSDPCLNRNLTLAEFIAAFNKYRNIMCEVWDTRKELDAYEAIVVGIASRIEGTAFYEYHKAFSAWAAALTQQHNVKLDWGLWDNGLFCSLFVGQTANVCLLCGSAAHLSSFCPMIANAKAPAVSYNFSRGPLPGRLSHAHTTTDVQGRPIVSVGQREICNNLNSDRGSTRQNCKFLHSGIVCRASHPSVVCPTKSNGYRARTPQPVTITDNRPPMTTQ